MPSITTPKLVLTEEGQNVKATVTYSITYSPIERFLVQNGLVFKQGIALLADDLDEPPHYVFDNWGQKTVNGKMLAAFPIETLKLPENGTDAKKEEYSLTVTRQALNEDLGNWAWWQGTDEVRARVYVVHHGLPFPTVWKDSNEWSLLGPKP